MKLSKSKYIHLLIMIAITIGISYCPPFGKITPYGMKALGAFIGVLYGWIAFDLMWSSIFGFFVLGALGLKTVVGSFQGGIGDQMIITVCLSMLFAVAIDMMGVTEFIANWLLKQKALRKSPWYLIAGILFTGYMIGLAGASMAGIFLLWAIVMRIAKLCEFPKQDPLISFMIMSITVSTISAAMVWPFKGGGLMFLAYMYQVTPLRFATAPFIIFANIMTIILVVCLFLFAKYILRLDASKFVLPDEILAEIDATKSTRKQKIGFIIAIMYLLALILPSVFSFPGAANINSLGIVGINAVALLIAAVLKVDGEPMISIPKLFPRVDWTMLLLLAVTYPLAEVMRSAESGIMPTIMTALGPLLGKLGPTVLIIMTMLLLGIITQFTHNIVLAAMFMPLLLPIVAKMGGNIYTMWFIMFMILNMAYCTPAGSFQSALVFGNEEMNTKYAYKFGIAYLVIGWVILGFVGIPLGNMLF